MNRACFNFKNYRYDAKSGLAEFEYAFDDGTVFKEQITFRPAGSYDEEAVDNALFLAFIVIGTSYFKTFPTPEVKFEHAAIDEWQADFLNKVYQEGLGQFAYENGLTRADLAQFTATADAVTNPKSDYAGKGTYVLQSGGKDSLLLAQLLAEADQQFDALYISSSMSYPAVIDKVSDSPTVLRRTIDKENLKLAQAKQGKNGHVPVTFIVLAIATVQAILDGKNQVLAAIGHEGEEPHAMINDLSVTHQWSKTWPAEQLFAAYVQRYISPGIKVGSPLRGLSELRIAELFYQRAWKKYGTEFSSCNVANYGQEHNNTELSWCGHCPKCANSFLLFAPFVPPAELKALFRGKNLLSDTSLLDTWKGLFGLEGKIKPFECVGETGELRLAYHMARDKWGSDEYALLLVDVPVSYFDYQKRYEARDFGLEVS